VNDRIDQLAELKIDRNAAPSEARRWPWIIGGVIIAATLIVFLVRGMLNAPIEVEVQTVRVTDTSTGGASVLDASGYVVARRQATVSSKIAGKVLEILIEEGMRVEEGQVVARLDSSTQAAQLALAGRH